MTDHTPEAVIAEIEATLDRIEGYRPPVVTFRFDHERGLLVLLNGKEVDRGAKADLGDLVEDDIAKEPTEISDVSQEFCDYVHGGG